MIRFGNFAAALVALAAVSIGCGDGRVAVYPVSGQVNYKGKPAAGATVIFYAQNAELKEPGIPIPEGTTADDGSFQLKSFEPADGAPAGEYKVSIVWNQVIRASNDPESQIEEDRLRGAYADPETSGLTATVTDGDNQLPPFELK
ncbi:MAG: hypothetical protein IT424_01180 [Pirellulales bacterium]|nr:hypothetical protein [Pirellulales bacterium]